MNTTRILLVGAAVVAATAIGWVYQSKTSTSMTTPELEIPVNIDYYLSGVEYRVMSPGGHVDYELRTPYLEHYLREDVSRVRSPQIDIYRDNQRWRLVADSAEILHEKDLVDLTDRVLLQKTAPRPLTLSAQFLRFDTARNQIIGEQAVLLTDPNSRIEARGAVFDLENNIYRFTRTRAVYNDEKS